MTRAAKGAGALRGHKYRYPFLWAGHLRATGVALLIGTLLGLELSHRLVLTGDASDRRIWLAVMATGYAAALAIALALGLARRRRSRNAWVQVDRTGITVADSHGQVRSFAWDEVRGVRFYRPKVAFYLTDREMLRTRWGRIAVLGGHGRIRIGPGVGRPQALADAIIAAGHLVEPAHSGYLSETWVRPR